MRLYLEIHSCRDPDNGATLPRCHAACAAVDLILLESSPSPAGWARVHSYTLKYAECKQCPLHPPAAAVSPPWSSADQWEVSPPSRPMGACHQALGQWEVSQCRDVPELRTNGRPRQHPWCSTHDQPAASTATSRYGETRRQAGKLVPPAPS